MEKGNADTNRNKVQPGSQALGRQSVRFEMPVYLVNSASVVGKKEGEGPLGELFDVVIKDDKDGFETWEEAESALQRDAVTTLLQKSGVHTENIRYLFAGDLLGQSIASTFGLMTFELPYIGLYGACSTCGLSLSLGSMAIAGGFAENVICVTSSHFASAEKEFRFPLSYGNQRPLSATWTVTGSGAFLLSSKKEDGIRAVISGITTGKIIDYGVKDSMNMGACMAPAAADIILQHMRDFNAKPEAESIQYLAGEWGMTDLTEFSFPATNPRIRIDYIAWYPKDAFALEKQEVVNEPEASDHRPVFADLTPNC